MTTPTLRTLLFASSVLIAPIALAATTAPNPTPPPPATHAPMHAAHALRAEGDSHGQAMGMFDRLDLSDAQRTSIGALIRADMDKAKADRKQIDALRTTFAAATPGTDAYRKSTRELAKASAKLAAADVERHAALREKIHAQLTPAQREQLASMHAMRQQRHDKMMQRMDRQTMRDMHDMRGMHKPQAATTSSSGK